MGSCTMWELFNQFMSSYCFCVRCEANVSRTGSQNKKDECGVEENKDKLEHIEPTVTPEGKLEPTHHSGLPWLLFCYLWYEQPEIEACDLYHRAKCESVWGIREAKEEVMRKL